MTLHFAPASNRGRMLYISAAAKSNRGRMFYISGAARSNGVMVPFIFQDKVGKTTAARGLPPGVWRVGFWCWTLRRSATGCGG